MHRSEAMEFLHEICGSLGIFSDVAYISLQQNDGDTRIVLQSRLDEMQKNILLSTTKKRNLRAIERPNNIWMIY